MKRALVGLALALVVGQTTGAAQVPEPPAWTSRIATINFEDVPMAGILGFLEEAVGFTLQMDKSLMPELETRLTIRIERKPIGEILSSLLSTSKLSYKIIDHKTVEVVRQSPTASPER